MFTSREFDEFAIGMGIKVLNSSPYYAQANCNTLGVTTRVNASKHGMSIFFLCFA
jgi:hypothetical protein